MRLFFVLFGLVVVATSISLWPRLASQTAAPEQGPPAQSAPGRDCLHITGVDFPGDWDAQWRARRAWVETCRQALAAEPDDKRIKKALGSAFAANGMHAESIALWHELGDADSMYEIYDVYKSTYRTTARKQLVKRAEAEQALRKSAELGKPYAILILAVLLDRGSTVKRDPEDAIRWARRALETPDKSAQPIDMQVLLARLLVKLPSPEERSQGTDLLEKLAQAGRGDAKAYLASAIRASDPLRARALLESGLRGYAGAVVPPLADMLIKGEGGPADPERAVKLLAGGYANDVPGVRGALGRLYIEGKIVPRDLKKGVDLLHIWASWDYDARLELARVLVANPEIAVTNPQYFLYDLTEATELDEPGAAEALIDLKLSQNAQFRDKPGGCALAERLDKSGDGIAARRFKECDAH
jgi:TPR repeat protein